MKPFTPPIQAANAIEEPSHAGGGDTGELALRSLPRSGGTVAGALLRACRPRQWTKNALVIAAPAAAGVLTHAAVVGRVALAFVAFCMLASSTYLVNDVRDREEDARHPTRRTRPVASGELPVRVALAAALVL
ncbi:MAG: UbiA family prenyltransferase, partial [Solirubrobacterales bacterium]|nr:UbiA family prenyltransferase [Solirubrobacterales bacterium]